MTTIQGLYAHIQTSCCSPGPKFFDMLCHLDEHETGYADVQKATEWLLRANTAYRSWNLPRMPGVTAEVVQKFFEKVEALAGDGPLVTALVRRDGALPPALWKLQKSQKELWASFGLLAEE